MSFPLALYIFSMLSFFPSVFFPFLFCFSFFTSPLFLSFLHFSPFGAHTLPFGLCLAPGPLNDPEHSKYKTATTKIESRAWKDILRISSQSRQPRS